MATYVILSLILIGVFSAYYAQQRGRDPYFWFLIGFFFGLLGFAFLMILPSVDQTKQEPEKNRLAANKEPFSFLPPSESNDFMTKDWFYLDSEHKQQGPVSFEILKKLFYEKAIKTTSFVWCEGMPEWKKIGDLPEIKDGIRYKCQ